MSLTTGIIYGVFGTLLFTMVCGMCFWAYIILDSKKHNRTIRIKNITAGKPYVETFRARKMKHLQLGDIYWIPALKKEDRHIAPYFGSKYEYSTNKANRFYVPLTFYNGTYSPEEYNPLEKVEMDVIEKNTETGKYERIKKEVVRFIIRPVKASIRQFNLEMDTSIKEEYGLNPGFWSKYGAMIIGLGIVMLCSIVGIMIIIFTYQWGVDISTAPDWVQTLIQKVAENQAPTTIG